ALDEARVVHPLRELPAGDARRCDLEQDRADGPAFADQGVGDVDAARGEVLAEGAGNERATELAGPPVVVLAGIGVHSLVGTAVDAAVGLVVAPDVHAADGHAAADRLLPDR